MTAMMKEAQNDPIDVWIKQPFDHYINNSTASGAVLFSAALLALILSNSPWAHQFHSFWETEISVKIGASMIEKDLHHWINDGLVAVFFFVVGLELKREIIAGELSNFKQALLPIVAAIGGMALPAVLFLIINPESPAADGWGIPMATDIAFALGIVYLLGDQVPVSLKVFLTTLAIVDDLGAVLVIAFFYTSDINTTSLAIGFVFLLLLALSNKLGIRSTLYYAILGIAGLWFTFLLSGIHPTIATVLVAFTIPARPKVTRPYFRHRIKELLGKLRSAKTIEAPVVSKERLEIVTNISKVSKLSITPLQRLESSLHPFVSFVVMPVFALSNAGITFSDSFISNLFSPLAVGILLGLSLGKLIGVSLTVWLMVKTGFSNLPEGMNYRHLLGAGLLAGIGFTMSLFVSGLAFTDPELLNQAKIAILISSTSASITGYFVLKSA